MYSVLSRSNVSHSITLLKKHEHIKSFNTFESCMNIAKGIPKKKTIVNNSVKLKYLLNKRRHFCNGNTNGTLDSTTKILKDLSLLAEQDPKVLSRLSKRIDGNTLKILDKAVELEAKALQNVKPSRPTNQQLLLVGLAPMPLFVVFGIIDNAVMILAGEYFDATLGVAFGISTMAAAGLGNLVSDVLGLGVGGFVEGWFEKHGLFKDAALSRAQDRMPIVRRVRLTGNAIGVSIGCLIGMFPLLFLDFDSIAKLKLQSQIDELFSSVMEYVKEALHAEAATLYVVDVDKQILWTKTSVGSKDLTQVRLPLRKGIAGHCAISGDVINISGSESLRRFGAKSSPVTGVKYKSVLCTPIFGRNGDIIGVLQVTNRTNGKPFRVKDEVALAAMSSHISRALEKTIFEIDENQKTDTDTLMLALKASFEHHQHHLRFASERAQGKSVSLSAEEE